MDFEHSKVDIWLFGGDQFQYNRYPGGLSQDAQTSWEATEFESIGHKLFFRDLIRCLAFLYHEKNTIETLPGKASSLSQNR